MTDKQSSRIVVGVDSSEGAGKALQWALAEAGRTGAEVEAILVWEVPLVASPVGVPTYLWDPTPVQLSAENLVRRSVEQAEAVLRAAGVAGVPEEKVSARAIEGTVAGTLVHAAREASMLVVGCRGLGGFKGLLVGSVSRRCLHHATCPVAVVPESWTPADVHGTVVVGVDGSPASAHALRVAVEMTRRREAKLLVVHSWFVPLAIGPFPVPLDQHDHEVLDEDARSTALNMVDAIHDAESVPMQVVALEGGAAATLLHYAEDADVLVVGSHGRGAVGAALLGSVSEQCAHHSPCPVVVVRSEA